MTFVANDNQQLAYETEHDVDLIHECVVKMAKEIAEFMNLSPNMQRMDSLMIAANIKKPVFVRTVVYMCCQSCKDNEPA